MIKITDRIDRVTHIKKEQLTTVPPPPIAVKIELTANCDFQCWFCATRKDLRKKKHMDFDMYTRLVDEMVEYGVEELGLFYLGESMLYPRLVEAVEYAKNAGMKYVFLTTNGYTATSDKLDKLFQAGLDSLKFSFNFPTSIACKETTAVDAFQTILTNIRAAHDVRAIGNYDVGIYVSSVEYSEHARSEMSAVIEQITPYIDEHYWLPLYNQGGFVKEDTGDQDVAGNVGRSDAMVNGQCCWGLFTVAHITFDGLMSACCFDHNGRFTMGDVRTHSFHDCWHSTRFQELRQNHIDCNLGNTPCATCVHRK